MFPSVLIALVMAVQGPAADPERLFRDAQRELAQGNPEKAAPLASRGLSLVLAGVGSVHLELSRYEEALQVFEEAVGVWPDPAALRGLAVAALRTGEYRRGLEAGYRLLQENRQDAEALQLVGKLQYMVKDYAKAATMLETVWRARSQDLTVGYTLALAQLQARQLEAGRRTLEALVRRFGSTAPMWILVGRAFRDTADPAHDSYGSYLKAAEEAFRKALEIDPQVQRAHYYLAMTLLRNEGMAAGAKALQEFRMELQVNPGHFLSHYYLGLLLTQNRRYQEALPHLQEARRLNPDFLDTELVLGRALFWLGRYEEAAAVLERLAGVFAGETRTLYHESNVRYLLGRSLVCLGRRDQARVHLLEADRLKRLWSQTERAEIMANEEGVLSAQIETTDRIEESASPASLLADPPPPEARQRELERALAESARAVAVGYQLKGRLAAARMDLEGTVEALEKAVRWFPEDSLAWFNLAVAQVKAGRNVAAVTSLLQALPPVESDVGSLSGAVQSGDALRLLASLVPVIIEEGRTLEAEKALDVLLQRFPQMPDLYYLRARLLVRQESWLAAAEALERAVALKPDFAQAFRQLAAVYARLGRRQEAQEALQRFRELEP
jgi:tetratricopeptide (TPR) repeat protein